MMRVTRTPFQVSPPTLALTLRVVRLLCFPYRQTRTTNKVMRISCLFNLFSGRAHYSIWDTLLKFTLLHFYTLVSLHSMMMLDDATQSGQRASNGQRIASNSIALSAMYEWVQKSREAKEQECRGNETTVNRGEWKE